MFAPDFTKGLHKKQYFYRLHDAVRSYSKNMT
jgi:hypothetical protein